MRLRLGSKRIGESSPTPAPYVGLVSTGVRTSYHYAGAGTPFWYNARCPEIAPQALTSIRVRFDHFYAQFNGEQVPTGIDTLTGASIEYPAGTFTRLLFSGLNTKVFNTGDVHASDYVTVSIPAGATYWVRRFGVTANGLCLTQNDNLDLGDQDTAFGSALEFSSTLLTDKSNSGTITNTYAPYCKYHLGVEANITRPSVVIYGDSISQGQADRYDGIKHVIGYVERALDLKFGYSNLSAAGEASVIGSYNAPRRLAMAAFASHAIVQIGLNNLLSGGRTGTQLITDTNALIASIKAVNPTIKVIVCVITTKTTSTDLWATPGNQTRDAKCLNGGDRDTYNAAVIAKTLVSQDLTMNLVSGTHNGNIWLSDGTARKYTFDGIHIPAFGTKAMASLYNPTTEIVR